MKNNNPFQQKLKEIKGNFNFILPFILLTALCIRLSLLPVAQRMHFNYISDSRMYADKALALLDGKAAEKVYHQGPLYPYFLAGICALTGRYSMYPALFIQMIFGLVTIFLVYKITKKISGSQRTAWISASLLTLYQPMIFYEGMILMESLLTFLYCLCILTLINAEVTQKKSMWFISGILSGVAALGRGSILLFPMSILVYKFANLLPPPKYSQTRPIFLQMLLFFSGIILAISPITIRNLIEGKDFVPLAANYGITFYEGNNKFAKGIYMDPPGLNLDQDFTGEKIASAIVGHPLKPSEVSRFWLKEAFKDIVDKPVFFIKLFILKTLYYWNHTEIPNAESYTFAKNYSVFYSIPLIGFPVAGIFGIAGIILTLIQRKKWSSTLLLFTLSHMIATVIFFISARYRISAIPVLLIFSSITIVELFKLVRKRAYKKLTLNFLILSVAAFIVFFPHKNVNSDYHLAQAYNNLGHFFHANKNVDSAQYYYQAATLKCPGYWKPYNNLGSLFIELGDKSAAHYWFQEGLKKGIVEDSTAMAIHMNLGICYASEGNLDEAKKHCTLADRYVQYSLQMRQIKSLLKL